MCSRLFPPGQSAQGLDCHRPCPGSPSRLDEKLYVNHMQNLYVNYMSIIARIICKLYEKLYGNHMTIYM